MDKNDSYNWNSNFPHRLEQFEELISNADNPIKSILDDDDLKEDLGLLFRICLVRSLKLGPDRIASEKLKPENLIQIAQTASAEGLLEISVSLKMQNTVENIKADLIKNDLWNPDSPFWWEPIPPPTHLEQIWTELDRRVYPYFQETNLSGIINTALQNGWINIPGLIHSEIIEKINNELINAYDKGQLTLNPEGTGQLATISEDRTDSVFYTNGRDTNLLKHSPMTAVFIQWLLKNLHSWLGEKLPEKEFSNPHNIMLSRYPANSSGYSRHLDNPGTENDNGRYLTLVVYLNSTNRSVNGGELALWNEGADSSEKPDKIIDPTGGTAVLLDSRKIPHQVMPLKDGPDRWALVIWFNDQTSDSSEQFLPEISLTNILLPIKKLLLPKDILLFHKMDEDLPSGQLIPTKYHPGNMRIGIISTVYQSTQLKDWCSYHFSIGVDHIVLVFDHLEEEREFLLSEKLLSLFGKSKLTVWDGNEMRDRWHQLDNDQEYESLVELTNYGGSSYSISARQTLNANVALVLSRTNSFGGSPLDWLIHLDDDEYFHLEGKGRGGDNIQDHFSAATNAGINLIRYVNHELLIEDSQKNELRYKVNPVVAESILGLVGWMKLSEYLRFDTELSYFNAYTNGKSAVYVPAGVRSAGMHSWYINSEENPKTKIYLAGPSILHKRFLSFTDFKQKYMEVASAPSLKDASLFPISSLEKKAIQIISNKSISGRDQVTIDRQLLQLYNSLIHSKKTVQILEKAGLLITPKQ